MQNRSDDSDNNFDNSHDVYAENYRSIRNGRNNEYFNYLVRNNIINCCVSCLLLLTPSVSQPVKFPSWKMHGQTCKKYIFWSYNICFKCCAFLKVLSHAV